ncbi:hypothetical protein [Candidatus Methylacidithermus pantelleriae]|uniref:Uncharacterized protein n=1 Tax=Candidatus Methylacidithermus pantelleriae TaxID=2744239 RepID=A0A8J2FMV0_9BACT|nr:hypothetical protein [Candidatus Methylacidithermus pantelleriae]CAF0689867.1 conserved exported hypothetical protein [Candidatus Methylacidithermus pantelleriae]
MSKTILVVGSVLLFLVPALSANAQEQKDEETVTVTGEVLDMVCYLDHGASGPKHAKCARTCINSGLPVGIKDKSGKVYLVVGEHKPLNRELAGRAASVVTLKGKLVSRDGINLLEDAEIIK